jgi:hypothetical protein
VRKQGRAWGDSLEGRRRRGEEKMETQGEISGGRGGRREEGARERSEGGITMVGGCCCLIVECAVFMLRLARRHVRAEAALSRDKVPAPVGTGSLGSRQGKRFRSILWAAM